MNKIPIQFEHRGKQYNGTLDPVFGAGSEVWYLMIDNYYCGRLRYSNSWVFDPTPKTEGFKELAGLFGGYVTNKKG